MGLTSIFVLLFCWSSVANGNTAPDIVETVYSTCEDTPKGAVAFQILATDLDGDPLTYSLDGPEAVYFTVEPSTGVVRLAMELDRETKPFLDDLVAVVGDPHNSVKRVRILVTITDTNDNRPIFEEATYDKSIPENTLVGNTLFKVKATDADETLVTYSISESVPRSGLDVFRVDRFGSVILKDKLNYTSISTFYRLKINATDSGKKCYDDVEFSHSTPVFAFITVVDVPDLDPRFIGIPYSALVEENTATGHTVLTVTAVDQDTGINDDIIYSIQVSPGAELFTINEKGVITVNGNIDRETIGDNVQLIVKATERGENINGVHASAATAVSISITDVNDNSPVFYKCEEDECTTANSFSGQVPEHSLGAVAIHMTVKDADKNSQTELHLEGPHKDVFSVEPPVVFSESIVQLLVKSPKDLDYELTQEMSLTVIAVDRGDSSRRTTAEVTITILDINDHSPTFTPDLYSAHVPEHCSDGTPVINITAQDPDTMDQGKLTYRLLPENILKYFDVNTTTGLIFVKNGELLDRESRALYSVTLQAQDSEGKPGNAVIDISVTDINDKTPVPNRNSYQEFVLEGQDLQNVRVEATDGDEPDTPNSQLLFSIVPGPFSENFTIDPDSGVLTNKGPLDREAINPTLNGKIELKVNISDRGLPPLSTLVQVIINVQDVNDNKPIFGKSSYSFSVKEGQKGAFVGSVDAKDNDQTTEFNRISFSIINGAFGSFTARSALDAPSYIGNINVDPDIELDFESTQKTFKLEMEAADFAQEKANIFVTVHVLDINDERPVFKPSAPVSVEENSKETAPIARFTAVDLDGNHSLVYELLSVKCRCDGEEMPCDWFDVEKSGSVIVNPNATIDYELCDQATVEAGVTDEYTEKGEADSEEPGKMVINILDMNDNAPEFVASNSLFVLVSESASMGTSVAAVSATDKDSGKNGQIEFKVSKVEYKNLNGDISKKDNLFEATTTLQNEIYVGIIQSTEEQDTTIQGSYLVTVEAKDTGGLTNTTVLEIFIIDRSFKFDLYFDASVPTINAQKSEIVRDLTAIVQAAVHVVTVKEDSSSERAQSTAIMEAYAIYANGTAVMTNNVHTLLSRPENFVIMKKHGLRYVGTAEPVEQKQDPLMFALYGMVGGLIIVTAVLTLSFVCTRRNYRRKLRAANAMKSASAVSENQRGPVVPGTNQYTMEGANPVLNLNIDSSIALDLNEDSDVDKLSLNSLDNSNDSAVYEKDTKPIMKKIQEEDEEQGPPMYIEPLGAALAQRGQKISNNPLLGDDNPIFDTTDL
ncbi:unnamed protein product [Knipowitschia caucasica]